MSEFEQGTQIAETETVAELEADIASLQEGTPLVGIIMGSKSDLPVMEKAAAVLSEKGISSEIRVMSAHRDPETVADYCRNAKMRGLQVIIAGAGGAAHLPGMTAALTALPVFGVPVESKALSGQDSLLSIVQMPAGIPVGTLAIGRAGAVNAALLAAAVLALLGQRAGDSGRARNRLAGRLEDEIDRWQIVTDLAEIVVRDRQISTAGRFHNLGGQQRVSGAELAILSVLLALGGAALWFYGPRNGQVPISTAPPAAPIPSQGPSAASADDSTSIATFCPNTTRLRSVSRLASVALSSLDTDLGGMRAIVAITASISFAVIVFLRFDGATSICIAPTSSITSIALSGNLRSLM